MRERIRDVAGGDFDALVTFGASQGTPGARHGRGNVQRQAAWACESEGVDHSPANDDDAPAADAGPKGVDPGLVSAAAFDAMVVDQLDLLPDDMVDGLDNVVFVTEDRPEDGSLDLLGLYDGVALTERGQYGFGELPDRIILYREPHLAAVDDLDQLADEIHVTLVHEIAHFYGLDDDQLHELGWA
ncbi:putative Zn-dependent protease with MMP-like domain [Frigoribacterium sp. PvP054]